MYNLLNEVCKNNEGKLCDEKHTAIVTMLCKVANIKCVQLNACQKLCGLLLRTSSTTTNTINKLSKLYDAVANKTLTKLLDQYSDETKEEIRKCAGENVIHAGDILDKRSKARYEVSGVSYHDVHLYNNMLYKARIPMDGLSDVKPTPPTPSEVDYRTFILSQAEEEKLLDLFQFAVLSAWQNHVPAAEKLNIVAWQISNVY